MARSTTRLGGLVLVTMVAAAGSADAVAFPGLPVSVTAKATPCKKGTVRWTVNKKPRCVKMTVRSVKPSADADPQLAMFTNTLTKDPLGKALNRTRGRKVGLRTALVNRVLGRGGATKLLNAIKTARARARAFRLPARAARAGGSARARASDVFTGPNGQTGSIDTGTGQVNITQPIQLGGQEVKVILEGNVITGELVVGTGR